MKEAIVLFHQALEADPEFATARLFRGLAGDSVPDIRQAAELAGKLPEAERLFILSYKAQYDSELPKAVEHAEQAVKLLPAEPRLRVRLAQLYSAATRRDDALAQLKRATEIDPKFAPAYRVRGEVQVARGDLNLALEARASFSRLMPDEAEPYQLIAHTYQQMQQFDKAVEHYTRALKIDPDYINVYRRRGDAKFFAGDVAGARADYRTGFERAKGKDRNGPLFAAAFTYVHEGEIDEGVKFYERAIETAKEDNDFASISAGFNALGQTLIEAGRLIEASRAYKQGYDWAIMAPDNSDKDKWLWKEAYQRARGRILARVGEFEAAKRQAELLRSMQEGVGRTTPLDMRNYHYLLGYIFLEKEDFAGALENLRQANTDDVFIKLLMARAHIGLGERANAEKLMLDIARYTVGSVSSSIARPEALRWLRRNSKALASER
jgi:tetratricopeptide (TPR) repeat protein